MMNQNQKNQNRYLCLTNNQTRQSRCLCLTNNQIRLLFLLLVCCLSVSACANNPVANTTDGRHSFQAQVRAVSLDSAAAQLQYTPVAAQLQTDSVSGYPFYAASPFYWQAGQQFQISAAQTPAYLYMFSIDAQNTVRIHYAPNADNKQLARQTPLLLPSDTQGLTLNHAGTEYFCMLYTTQPIPKHQQLIEGLELTRGTMMQRIGTQFGKWMVPHKQLVFNPQTIGFETQLPQPDSVLQIVPLVFQLKVGSAPPAPQPPKTDSSPVQLSVLGIGVETPFSKYNRQSIAHFMGQFAKAPSNALFAQISTDTLCGKDLNAGSIMQTIKQAAQSHNLTQNDLLFVYLASNAYYNKNGELCLLTGNQSGIRYQEIANLLATMPCRKVVFLQNGFSKIPKNRNNTQKTDGAWGAPADSLPPLPPLPDEQLLLISSNEPKQACYESDALKISIFSQAIADVFAGKANTDKDKNISSSELIAFLKTQIPRLAEQQKQIQKPAISPPNFPETAIWTW